MQHLYRLSLLAGLVASGGALANQTPPNASELLNEKFIAETRDWLSNPIVELSINAQNEKRGSLSQGDIDSLDKQWRAEREIDDKPLISETLSAPLSVYLLRIQADNLGLFTEIFVMDSNGLNVGQSAITSDYWQGDEAKFQKTFPKGSNAVFIDEPEWDEDRKIWRAQLNLTLADQESNEAIGAATVEVNLTELQRRLAD